MNYTYQGTRAYTRAHTLLSDTDRERLITATDTAEALRVLDSTFIAGEITRSEGDVETALEYALRNIKAEFSLFASPVLMNLFWHRFDFFNVSIIEKGLRLKEDREQIINRLNHVGLIDPTRLFDHMESLSFLDANIILKETIARIKKVTSPSELDIVADEGYMQFVAQTKAQTKDMHIKKYATRLIDTFNITASIRYHKGLKEAITHCPFVNGGTFTEKQLETLDAALYALTSFLGSQTLETDDMHVIEQEIFNRHFVLLQEDARAFFSAAPLLYFFERFKLHTEIIRAIIRSKRAHVPEGDIRAFIHQLF